MFKKIIINILKVSLALGLIIWLVKSDKLDFFLLKDFLKTPLTLIFALFVFQVVNAIGVFRLRIFLHQKVDHTLPFSKMFLAGWIGQFFNSVLPGSVSGDFVKIFYLRKLDQKLTKKFLILSVFVDRIVGLMGLILLGGIASVYSYTDLISLSTDVKFLTHVNMLLAIGIMISISFLFIAPNLPYKISHYLKKINIALMNSIITKLENIWEDLIIFKHKLLALIGLSMLIQGVAILIFWWLTSPFAQGNFNLITSFSIMPIGFISTALPIAPAGLGVGHVTFEKLLGFFNVNNGASLFNLYFFILMISNLTGIIPYLLHKSEEKVDFTHLSENLDR